MKSIQYQIDVLKNKLARATTKPDPTGRICEGLRQQIAALEAKKR